MQKICTLSHKFTIALPIDCFFFLNKNKLFISLTNQEYVVFDITKDEVVNSGMLDEVLYRATPFDDDSIVYLSIKENALRLFNLSQNKRKAKILLPTYMNSPYKKAN